MNHGPEELEDGGSGRDRGRGKAATARDGGAYDETDRCLRGR